VTRNVGLDWSLTTPPFTELASGASYLTADVSGGVYGKSKQLRKLYVSLIQKDVFEEQVQSVSEWIE
jgi:hypothetical protein